VTLIPRRNHSHRLARHDATAHPNAEPPQRMPALALLGILLGGWLSPSVSAPSQLGPAAAPSARPNIIFILIDDLRWDEMDYPFVQLPNLKRIAREGVRFRNAFVTTPLCSPSRASFLTGQYAHNHGITDNVDRSPRSHALITFPRLLRETGYETAFLGKWHMGVDDTARPGFDHWVSVKGQGTYLDPAFNVNGERVNIPGYFTDILNRFAVDFLKRKRARPFLLYIAHKGVHPDVHQYADGSVSDPNADKFIPAERHKHLYAGAPIPRRPNYGKHPEGKPALRRQIGDLPPLGPHTATDDETIRNRLRMLAAVDDGVGDLLHLLEEQKQLDNTLIVFTSDEGYFYGEHGLSVERRLAYEESVRIPLFMRWPRLIKAGSSLDQFVLNIDVAPTLLEIGGAPAAKDADGRSLLPLLRGQKIRWRNSFLIEYFSDKVFPRVLKMGYQAVRTPRWTYIHYLELEGMDELYDLRADPYQLKNLIAEPRAQPALRFLKSELARLLKPPR
jgi:N-acetylglucosamine-6-sulfatase